MNFFAEVFEYQFLINAALACLLCGVACGVIGTYIVCRRMVFLSGGITHSSFGGIGMAYYMGLNPILGALVFAVISSIGIEAFSSKANVREDSAIGLMWSLGMAIGIIFVYLTPGYAPNLMSYLFGNILTVNTNEIWFMAVIDAVILITMALLYRPVFYIAFDKNYAKSQNVPVSLINYMMAVLVAVTIVMSIRVVGIVLLISLLTIPVMIVNMMTKSFSRIMIFSSIIASLGAFVGLYISYRTNIPSGASTIFVLTITLIIVKILTLRAQKSVMKQNRKN